MSRTRRSEDGSRIGVFDELPAPDDAASRFKLWSVPLDSVDDVEALVYVPTDDMDPEVAK